MVDRRGFLWTLLAIPAVAGAVKAGTADLPLRQSGEYPYDAFCFTRVPATADWKEHGEIHLLKSGDAYPKGFEGWVAFRHPDGPERVGIRWGGGDQTHYNLLALGEPVFNDDERSLTFHVRKASRVLIDLGNRRRMSYGYYGVHYRTV